MTLAAAVAGRGVCACKSGRWGERPPAGEVLGAVAQARDLVAFQEVHYQQPPRHQARHAARHRQRPPQPLAPPPPPSMRSSERPSVAPFFREPVT